MPYTVEQATANRVIEKVLPVLVWVRVAPSVLFDWRHSLPGACTPAYCRSCLRHSGVVCPATAPAVRRVGRSQMQNEQPTIDNEKPNRGFHRFHSAAVGRNQMKN
ncbi:hypothetical protein AMJ85_07145 [candidate division BRC1 bacterium SM23_51]|nr:MAG: hypothetical protein AMJ85_07145 [candidate division BRC1 bacterium SM23_51]